MRLRADDRGLAVQVGVTILLGFVVIALATYQVQVVPSQNRGVELDHSQRVGTQLQDVRNSIVSVPGGGPGRSVTVTLGATYPSRTVFVNPPPPSGSLTTTDAARVRLVGANAAGETGDFWNGSTRSFVTRGLTYRPDYSEFRGAPTTVYENTVVYDGYDDGRQVVKTDQVLVDGSTITVVTLNGTYQAAGSTARSVDVRAVSTSTRTVTVSNASGLSIEVPTRLGQSEWMDLLDDEPNASVGGYATGSPFDTVTIDLAPGSYDLRMARVGVGTDVAPRDSAYVTTPGDDGETTTVGGRVRLVAEVRDEFNNPLSGRTVRAPSTVGGGDLTLVTNDTVTTDSEGRAAFVYRADAGGSFEVPLSIRGGTTPAEVANYTVDVSTGGSSGGGSSAFEVNYTSTSGPFTCDADLTDCTFDAGGSTTGDLTIDTTPTADGARIEYAVNDTGVATLSSTQDTTDASGESTTTLEATADGTVAVFASGGGSGDVVNVTVTNSGGGTLSLDSVTITDNRQIKGNGRGQAKYEVGYQVDDPNGNLGNVTAEFNNLDKSPPPKFDKTATSMSPSATLSYEAPGSDDTDGDQYRIRVKLYDDTGTLVECREYTDTADGTDPSPGSYGPC